MTESTPSPGPAHPSTPDFAAWNERMVERYDIERYYAHAHPIVRWIEARRIDALIRLACAGGEDRVLEVGCGAGHVLERFASARRTGVDLSPTMLERAARRLGSAVTLFEGSAEALPLDSAAFDVVLCTEVLEHVQNPRQVIRELMRVGTPDARIVVSVPNEGMIDRAKRALRRTPVARKALKTLASEGNEWHLHHMDLPTLRGIVEGIAKVKEVRAVPNRLIPLRWVVRLAP